LRRTRCPAALLIALELAADVAAERFARTRTHRARKAMEDARTAALRGRR